MQLYKFSCTSKVHFPIKSKDTPGFWLLGLSTGYSPIDPANSVGDISNLLQLESVHILAAWNYASLHILAFFCGLWADQQPSLSIGHAGVLFLNSSSSNEWCSLNVRFAFVMFATHCHTLSFIHFSKIHCLENLRFDCRFCYQVVEDP